jgi:filamentous hemagglutinin
VYFTRFGFSLNAHVVLLEALLAHPDSNQVIAVQENDFGTKSVVQCTLRTPDGRDPCIFSVWFLDRGSKIQRLVTAYPATE